MFENMSLLVRVGIYCVAIPLMFGLAVIILTIVDLIQMKRWECVLGIALAMLLLIGLTILFCAL